MPPSGLSLLLPWEFSPTTLTVIASVVLGDLPFWWLILDPRPSPPARVRGGYRLLMLFVVMLPMMLAGAILSLSRHYWYPVYGICGRFAPIAPLTDQHLGGLIIWIPGNVLLLIVALIVLRRALHQEHASRVPAATLHRLYQK